MPQLFDCHSVAFNLERPALDYSSTTQVVAAITDVLLPVGGLLKISSAAAVVMNASSVSTANAKAGDLLTILNVNARLAATDYLTLTRGTYLKLGAATRVLQTYGSIELLFDGTAWTEVGFLATATLA